MEILIQFKRSMWSLNKRGIRRIPTIDFLDAFNTFEEIYKAQNAKIKKQISTSVLPLLDKEAEKGLKSAIKNAEAWRKLDDNRLPKPD